MKDGMAWEVRCGAKETSGDSPVHPTLPSRKLELWGAFAKRRLVSLRHALGMFNDFVGKVDG